MHTYIYMLKKILLLLGLYVVHGQLFHRTYDLSHTLFLFLDDRNLTNCFTHMGDDFLTLKCMNNEELVTIQTNIFRQIHYI